MSESVKTNVRNSPSQNNVKRMIDMSLREYDYKRDRFTEYYLEFEFEKN